MSVVVSEMFPVQAKQNDKLLLMHEQPSGLLQQSET